MSPPVGPWAVSQASFETSHFPSQSKTSAENSINLLNEDQVRSMFETRFQVSA